MAQRGRVTIPKQLRERLGIRPGTVLEFQEDRGRLVVSKQESADVVDQVYGSLGKGRRTEDVIDALEGLDHRG